MYVSKVHSAEYVNFVKNLSIAVEGALEPVPFTPRVQTAFPGRTDGNGTVKPDSVPNVCLLMCF